MNLYKIVLLVTFVLAVTLEKSSAQFVIDPANTTNIYNTNLSNGRVGIGKIADPDGTTNVLPPGAQIKSPLLQIHGISGKTGGVAQIQLPVVKITATNSTNSIGLGFDDLGYPSFLKYAYVKTEGRYRIISSELEVIANSYFRSKVILAPTPNWMASEIATPGSYRLYVQGGILTEKIKVALTTDAVNWSDFVFAKDYKLRSLSEVESYVKKHHHLPEIPSSEEIYKDGLDLAQMDAKLLMKIEELTLYMIELKKENEKLKEQMELLNAKIK